MAKGPRRSGAKEKFWREQITRQQSSGLTFREFCRREGLSEQSMHGWRREIARRDAESGTTCDHRDLNRGHSPAGQDRSNQSSAGRLLPIRVIGGFSADDFWATHAQTAPIEIILPTNLRVLVRPGFDPHLLRQVIDTLGMPSSASHGELPC